MKQAKLLFEKAEESAKAKEYLPSADYYLGAYELFPSSDFIFNAASMFHLAGDKENAKKYFEEYLSLDSDGRGAAEANSTLALYEKERNEDLQREQKKQSKAEDAKRKSEKDPLVANKEKNKSKANKSSSQLPAILGISAGGVLVGVGGFFAIRSRSISDEVSESPIFDPELEKKGKEAARNSYIFGGIGAAAIVGSIVYYLVGGSDESEDSSLSFQPQVGEQSIGAFAYGEF